MEPSRSTTSTDKKRKRSAPDQDRLNNLDTVDRSAVGKEDTRSPPPRPPPPPPSEEEVDEFFKLLRRIHSTGKPSGKGNRAVRSRRFEFESRLVNGGESGEKMDRVEEGADNGVMVFDLNAVPDEAQEAKGC